LRQQVAAPPPQVRAFSQAAVEVVAENPPGRVPELPLAGTARYRA